MKTPNSGNKTASFASQLTATGVTRRDFCFASLVAPLAAFMIVGPVNGKDTPELTLIMDSMHRLASTRPNLPGVQSLMAMDQQRLGQGFTDTDLEILTGALYLEAERQLRRIPVKERSVRGASATRRRINKADVHAVLSKPVDTTPYGHDYFAKILDEAKARLAADPLYRRQLTDAQTAARQKTCINGHTPRWICVAMAVIVVIAIVLIFL